MVQQMPVLNLLQSTSLPLGIISFSDMFGLVLIVYLCLGIWNGVIGSIISDEKILRSIVNYEIRNLLKIIKKQNII